MRKPGFEPRTWLSKQTSSSQQNKNLCMLVSRANFIQCKRQSIAVPYEFKNLTQNLGIHLHTHEYT
jgi:hypothetical protein